MTYTRIYNLGHRTALTFFALRFLGFSSQKVDGNDGKPETLVRGSLARDTYKHANRQRDGYFSICFHVFPHGVA